VSACLVQLAHISKNAYGTDDLARRIAQRRRIQGRRNDFTTRTPRVKDRVARDTMFDDLAQRRRELAQLFRADELRQRLLEQLVWAEAEQLGHRVISLQNLALEVRHENR